MESVSSIRLYSKRKVNNFFCVMQIKQRYFAVFEYKKGLSHSATANLAGCYYKDLVLRLRHRHCEKREFYDLLRSFTGNLFCNVNVNS